MKFIITLDEIDANNIYRMLDAHQNMLSSKWRLTPSYKSDEEHREAFWAFRRAVEARNAFDEAVHEAKYVED